jgi:hypothetical protein
MTVAAKADPSVIGAVNYPQYGSSGTTKLTPEVWSGKLLVKFYAATLFGDIANTDYQGNISSMGDKVWIRTTPNVTIRDYQKGQILDIEAPASDAVELAIDKAKYWNFVVDDVDRFQSDLDYVDGWTQDASTQLKINIDRDILASIRTSAGNTGTVFGTTGANALVLTKNNVLDVIVDAMTVLDEKNVPEENRYVVLPPWAVGMIKKSDLKDASLAGDGTSILRNGRVGMIDRATIYMSNLLPSGEVGGLAAGETGWYFGQRHALSFASQLTKNEGPITSERTFGKLYRGLQVYGYDVLKADALGYGVIKK